MSPLFRVHHWVQHVAIVAMMVYDPLLCRLMATKLDTSNSGLWLWPLHSRFPLNH